MVVYQSRCVWYFRCIRTFGFFFFFNDTATTEIYTLSLHDALPISTTWAFRPKWPPPRWPEPRLPSKAAPCWRWRADRKSTRLNSSHLVISYAVFCLKKKKFRYSLLNSTLQRGLTC